ncbi:hypothetical protein [Shinella sp.]|uniref:hypothetical protein n=1 Tax=Shinella sp. TaxID=1870904 RepID=UPI0028B1A006|nr:hypothetical protein [Shinella sp.]
MKRRSFLAALFAVPIVPTVARAIEAQPTVDVPADMSHLPLIFEGGELKMSVAEIGQVRAGRLLSSNGFVIDLAAGKMTFKA